MIQVGRELFVNNGLNWSHMIWNVQFLCSMSFVLKKILLGVTSPRTTEQNRQFTRGISANERILLPKYRTSSIVRVTSDNFNA